MPTAVTDTGISTEAFEAMARVQQLGLEAGRSDDHKQLVFRILNRSILCCRDERAVLWDLARRKPRLLGVSGAMTVDPRSPVVADWCRLVAAMANRDEPALVDADAFPGCEAIFKRASARTRGLCVAWLPIQVAGRTVAGLWLERWGTDRFTADDLARLEVLASAYGVAWRAVVRRPHWLVRGLSAHRRAAALIGTALLAAALFGVHVPLRVVAHCEVIPANPVAVTAPLQGVIDEIPVLPGRRVEQGELLAVYDKRLAVEEMNVARRQVQIIQSELQRARVQAFDDASARSAIALLENRLEQERIRLQTARRRVEQSEIRAPVSGTIMFDDPNEWRGRPVQVGQRLMMIVDPARTKLRIWLPDGDNVAFDQTRPLKIVLDADPRTSRSARLRFLANHSEAGPGGRTCFRAEAEWIEAGPNVKTGLQGSAVLYGAEVPLGYWLVRRPLAAVRRYFGL